MKKSKISNLVLSVTLFAAIALASCNKETPVANNGATETTDSESTLKRIMDFKEQIEYYRSRPDVRDGASVTLDEALWSVEALFNVTYAYPELAYTHTVVCDTVLYLETGPDSTVPMNRLASFYDEMHETVSTLYHGIELDNKQFLILDVEEGERQGDAVAVRLHGVQGSVRAGGTSPGHDEPTTEVGPFEEGVSWWYGKNSGNSQGQFVGIMDAADTLMGMLNARLVPEAPEGFEYIYTHTVMKQTPYNEHYIYPYGHYPDVTPRYCEFYMINPIDDDFLMDPDEMNFHYFGERYLVMIKFPVSLEAPIVPSGHSLFQVIIEDYDGEVNSNRVIGHHTTALYGHREAIGHGGVVRGIL